MKHVRRTYYSEGTKLNVKRKTTRRNREKGEKNAKLGAHQLLPRQEGKEDGPHPREGKGRSHYSWGQGDGKEERPIKVLTAVHREKQG